MKKGLSTKCVTLTVLATGLLLPACEWGPKPGEMRWGIVVLFEDKDGVCKHLSGPQRVGAYPTEEIVWRIHNKCRTPHRFELSDIRLEKKGWAAPSQTTNQQEASRRQATRTDGEKVNPFEGDLFIDVVPPKTTINLSLRVKAKAQPGLYTFVSLLDGNPNEDDEADIWPPR